MAATAATACSAAAHLVLAGDCDPLVWVKVWRICLGQVACEEARGAGRKVLDARGAVPGRNPSPLAAQRAVVVGQALHHGQVDGVEHRRACRHREREGAQLVFAAAQPAPGCTACPTVDGRLHYGGCTRPVAVGRVNKNAVFLYRKCDDDQNKHMAAVAVGGTAWCAAAAGGSRLRGNKNTHSGRVAFLFCSWRAPAAREATRGTAMVYGACPCPCGGRRHRHGGGACLPQARPTAWPQVLTVSHQRMQRVRAPAGPAGGQAAASLVSARRRRPAARR